MGKKGKSANKYRKVEISHENIKRENLKAYKGIVFFALILLTIVIGTSYALFSTVKTSKKTVEVEAGTFKISFLDSNNINLENTYPMTDEEGLNTSSYKFTITNNGTLNGKYNISLEESGDNTLDKSYVKYSIKEGEGEWSTPALLSNGIILSDNKQLNSSEHIDYELKLWLDESAPNEVQGKKYQAKIVVSATQTNANMVYVAQPIINLNGAKVMNVEQSTSFTDPGVSSIQAKEEIDVSTVTKRYEYFDGVNTTTVESIDTSKVGTYYIYYEVLDSSENKGLSIRIVNVYKINTTPPTIQVNGEENIILNYGDEYVDEGAVAQDAIDDGDLTSKIVTVGEINTKKEGIQIVKYLIIDNEGNTASAVRTVNVRRKYADASGNFVLDTVNSTPTKQLVLINITTDYPPLTFAITSSGDTPDDSDYKTIEQLETEKLAEDGKLVFTRNGDYVIWTKDNEGSVQQREISIYNIDMTKPTCEFNSTITHIDDEYYHTPDGYIMIGHEGSFHTFFGKGFEMEVYLDCHDIVDIEEKNLTDQVLKVTNPDVMQIVSIERTGKMTEGNNKGYHYRITLRGLKAGTSKLVLSGGVISDLVGNVNDEVETSWDYTVSELDVEEDEMELVLGGIESKKINVTGTNLYEKLAYRSTNEEVVTVDSDGVITAVSTGKASVVVIDPQSRATKEVKVKVTAQVNFMGGEGVEALHNNRLTCELNDASNECQIKLPGFEVMDGYTAVGWNTDDYEGVGTAPETTINVSKGITYYAIAIKPQNENIKAVYTYNQTAAIGEAGRCITGKEETCQVNNCIENRTKGSCPAGTIIKYEVKDGEEKVFYVLHDDGRRMTLQQRENTIKSAWYAGSDDNTKGPITALENLDSVTSDWTNVRNLKYTMGTTNFLSHSTFANTGYATSFTKCHDVVIGACSVEGYTMEERTGKARFITMQEASAIGCGYAPSKPTCPIFMYNYLDGSADNGGTDNDNTNGGSYHIMSAFGNNSSTTTTHNFFMVSGGYFGQIRTAASHGIRAVIEIDK